VIPFIDGHNDFLLAPHLADAATDSFLARRSEGHLDVDWAGEDGFAAGLFAVFMLPKTEAERKARASQTEKLPYAQPLAARVPSRYAIEEVAALVDLRRKLAAVGAVHLARSVHQVETAREGGPHRRDPPFSSRVSRTWMSCTGAGCAQWVSSGAARMHSRMACRSGFRRRPMSGRA
jgi:hypothetical protein